MKIPYLGQIILFWCDNCNVPVLSKRCETCENDTIKVPITPPGDIRPAFENDINLINRACKKQFGSNIIEDKRIVLLNSVPGFDRFDEIITDGQVIGALRFDVKNLNYIFMPRIAGAARISDKIERSFVEVAKDAGEFIKQGMSVLLPGVVKFDKTVLENQEVIVICENRVIAVGKTKFSGKHAKEQKKGMFVKVRKYLKEEIVETPPDGQDWDLVLNSNRRLLNRFENEALEFIKKNVENKDLPVIVSYSGGKDSLATLLMVRKVVEPTVLFIDTGIEFPETYAHVKMVSQRYNLKLIIANADNRFWDGLKIFGMSGRDYRWCCKVCKLGPVAKIIDEKFPDGILNFIGQRRYESAIRAGSGRVWRNSWLPNQLAASPIQNWNALHIWLYLFREGVEYNPLYRLGLERIGCWLCPSSSLSEIELVKKLHPKLWKLFEETLLESGFTKKEIKHGFWRWLKLPKGQKELLNHLAINENPRETVVKTLSVNHDRASNLSTSLDTPITEDIVLRSSLCLGCGICLAHCELRAIEFQDGKIWLNSNCVGCKNCHLKCPIVKYLYDNNYN
jgi:phosphoadenosine phosphosulfate reductase